MTIVELLVAVLLIGLLFWAIGAIANAFGIPAPVVTVIHVVLVILVVLWLLQAFGLTSSGPTFRVS